MSENYGGKLLKIQRLENTFEMRSIVVSSFKDNNADFNGEKPFDGNDNTYFESEVGVGQWFKQMHYPRLSDTETSYVRIRNLSPTVNPLSGTEIYISDRGYSSSPEHLCGKVP